jgi:hypothetical protein
MCFGVQFFGPLSWEISWGCMIGVCLLLCMSPLLAQSAHSRVANVG